MILRSKYDTLSIFQGVCSSTIVGRCLKLILLSGALGYLVVAVLTTFYSQRPEKMEVLIVSRALNESDSKIESKAVLPQEPVEKTTKKPQPSLDLRKPVDRCLDKSTATRLQMRGTQYWALYNYIKPSKHFRCNQSITYTTHSELTYLHNLEPLLERWQGPVSLSIFTPGTDYEAAVEAIFYYRQCRNGSRAEEPTLVSQFVTFHLFYPVEHLPSGSFLNENLLLNYRANCDQPPPNVDQANYAFQSYKSKKSLLYPINVGRNIAREGANTYYVFASDIELYPSPNLIPRFLEMVRSETNNHAKLTEGNDRPRVYVNTIFEMKRDLEMPRNKSTLIEYLGRGDAVTFHKLVCEYCHLVPKFKEWKKLPPTGKVC